jgi:hypothetical protein
LRFLAERFFRIGKVGDSLMSKPIWAALLGAVLLSACATKPVATLTAVDPAIRSAMAIQNTEVRYDAELNAQTGLDQDQLRDVLAREFSEQVPQIADRSSARNVVIDVEILAYREPNAALAILLGDTSQIVGNVKVLDAESREMLGEYYIEVIEGAGGLIGLAAADTTEVGLGREFVEHFVRYLNEDAPS